MPTEPGEPLRFTNPLIDHDVPDPDAIALTSGGYALVASSFDRSPGLPLWRSDDLVNWHPIGHAGGYRRDAPHDGGVWAPSIREHGGRLYIVWGDPDLGVFVSESDVLEGPWSEPRLVREGRGLIDACPYWDEDGRAWVVHGYARSRAGFANRIDVFEMDPGLSVALSASRTVIDGDDIPGCTVLEGPKIYRRDGELWIFAPAGGVATGWQYAFRASSWAGPWEHRVILEQGSTSVNGPHQGAWVEGIDGEEWFLHFQAKPALGRVLHLQPLTWGPDGWPHIGAPGRTGAPVESWTTPRSGTTPPPTARGGDDFRSDAVSPVWHARGATPHELVARVGDGSIALTGHPDAALLRPIEGAQRRIDAPVRLADEADAVFVLADSITRELVVRTPIDELCRVEIVTHDPSGARVQPVADLPLGMRIGVRVHGLDARFLLDGCEIGDPFTLEGRRWTGAEWGLAARGRGHAVFGAVEVTA